MATRCSRKLVKPGAWDPDLDSDSVYLGCGLRFCISNKHPNDAAAAGPETTPLEHCHRKWCRKDGGKSMKTVHCLQHSLDAGGAL